MKGWPKQARHFSLKKPCLPSSELESTWGLQKSLNLRLLAYFSIMHHFNESTFVCLLCSRSHGSASTTWWCWAMVTWSSPRIREFMWETLHNRLIRHERKRLTMYKLHFVMKPVRICLQVKWLGLVVACSGTQYPQTLKLTSWRLITVALYSLINLKKNV